MMLILCVREKNEGGVGRTLKAFHNLAEVSSSFIEVNELMMGGKAQG